MAQELAELLESLDAQRYEDALRQAEAALEGHKWIDSVPDAWEGPEGARSTLAAEEAHIVAILAMRGEAARHCRPGVEAEEMLEAAIARPSTARWLESGTYELWVTRARCSLSEVLRLDGRLERARELAEEARTWYLMSQRMPAAALAQLTLVWIAETSGRLGEAADRLLEAIAWRSQLPHPSEEASAGSWSQIAHAAAALGQRFLNEGDPKGAARLLKPACDYYAFAGDRRMGAACTLMLGIAYLRGGQYLDAVRFLRAALDLGPDLDVEQTGRCHLELGIALRLAGRLTDAEVESTAAVDSLRGGRLASDALTNLARVLTLLERDAEAEAAFLAAIQAAEPTADSHDIARAHGGYGDYLAARSRPDESLSHLLKARAANRAMGDSEGVADCDVALSTACEDMGRPAMARMLLDGAIATYRQLGSRIGLGNALVQRGIRAMRSGKRSTAELSFRSARRQYRGHPYGIALATDWLGLLGLKFGRPDARAFLLAAISQWEALGLLDTADLRLEQLLRASRKSDTRVADLVFQDVQAWANRLPARRAAALVTLESARLALREGDVARAKARSAEAIRRYRGLVDSAGVTEAEQVLAKTVPIGDAAVILGRAVRRLERDRRRNRTEFEQFRESARWRELYDDAVLAAVNAQRYEDALELAVATMGRLQDDEWQLNEPDAANETLATLPVHLNAADRTRWTQLSDRRLEALAELTRAIADDQSEAAQAPRVESAERDVMVAQEAWWTFYESVRRRIARRRARQPRQTIRLARLRAAVTERRVAMVLFLWRPQLRLAFVLRPGDTTPVVHRFDGSSDALRRDDERIEDLVRAWRDRALEGEWSVLDDRIWQTRLATLESVLWGPIRRIVGTLPVRLTPDEGLASVPGAWLDRARPGSLRTLPAPSLLLTRPRSGRHLQLGRSLLAIGDDAHGRYVGVRCVLEVARGWPGGRATIVSGAGTVAALLDDRGKYEVVLLVAHGNRSGDPKRLGIMLSETLPGSGRSVPREISVFELLRLGIRARTVLIMGCANLSPAVGPELLSVAAAVQVATRANAVLATSTRVSDLGAALVWSEIRNDLARGEPLDDALATALERIAEGTTPTRLDDYLDRLLRTGSGRRGRDRERQIREAGPSRSSFATWATNLLRSRATAERGDGPLLPLLDRAGWVLVGA
jgi:tetratricopeptide (TPR) repeat protein